MVSIDDRPSDSTCEEFQFPHCDVSIGQKGRVECKKYDALRVGFIQLSFIQRSM